MNAQRSGAAWKSWLSVLFLLGWTYAAQAAPPALTILHFTVDKNIYGKVEIEWKTSQEVNVSHFSVEWSADGRKWQPLGNCQAKGQNSTVQEYSYIDQSPSMSVNYYRLVVVDYDEHVDYSPVRLINLGKGANVRVYPSLARANTTMYLEGISPEKCVIQWVNSQGQPLPPVRPDSNSFTIPALMPGSYHVRVIDIQTMTVVATQQVVIY